MCAVFNVYFVVYELYIYYDMLKYPLARIGNRLYDYYIIRYGTFLKNIRYEEYDVLMKRRRSTSNGPRSIGSGLTISTSYPTTKSS